MSQKRTLKSISPQFCQRSPQEVLQRMNQEYSLVDDCGQVIVVSFRDGRLYRYRLKDFENLFLHCTMPGHNAKGDAVNVPLGYWWLHHEGKRFYNGLKFFPGKPESVRQGGYLYLNLWRGFPQFAVMEDNSEVSLEPKQGDWPLLQFHMLHNVCGDNPEHFNWLMAWMAVGIQEPSIKPGVCVVMRGKEGTGKGTVAKYYRYLFGEYGIKVEKPDQLTGRFNEHLEYQKFLEVGEAFYSGPSRAATSALKCAVTDDTFSIEPKGFKLRKAKSYLHIMMTSNDDWVVPAALEERRFTIFDMGDDWIQNHDQFGALNQQMEQEGGLAAFLYDLQHFNYSAINYRKALVTVGLRDNKLASLDPEPRWLYEILMRGTLTAGALEWDCTVAKEDLHAQYRDYMKSERGHRSTETTLSIFLWKWFAGTKGKLKDSRPQTGAQWHFPELEICRQILDEKIGMPIDWPAAPQLTDVQRRIKERQEALIAEHGEFLPEGSLQAIEEEERAAEGVLQFKAPQRTTAAAHFTVLTKSPIG